MSQSPAAPSTSSSSSSSLSDPAEVARLRQRFAELRRAEGAARVRLLLLVLVVVVLFAGFAFVTVNRVRDNFNEPAVHKAVADRLPEVLPPAGEQLQKAATAALPTYRKLAAERFEQVRPELAAKARARLERVPEETGHMMNEAVRAAFDGALKRIEPEVKRTFPSLTDAQKQDLLNAYFHDAIEARNKEIAGHVERAYTNELTTMRAALDGFELPREESGGGSAAAVADKAQRDFLHALLVLADFEVLDGDALGGTGGTGATDAPKTPGRRVATTAPSTQAASRD